MLPLPMISRFLGLSLGCSTGLGSRPGGFEIFRGSGMGRLFCNSGRSVYG